jgi:hypothetical protein
MNPSRFDSSAGLAGSDSCSRPREENGLKSEGWVDGPERTIGRIGEFYLSVEPD